MPIIAKATKAPMKMPTSDEVISTLVSLGAWLGEISDEAARKMVMGGGDEAEFLSSSCDRIVR